MTYKKGTICNSQKKKRKITEWHKFLVNTQILKRQRDKENIVVTFIADIFLYQKRNNLACSEDNFISHFRFSDCELHIWIWFWFRSQILRVLVIDFEDLKFLSRVEESYELNFSGISLKNVCFSLYQHKFARN